MAVTYFVRMIAKEGQAENVVNLLLVNPKRIEEGKQGNIVFGVHRSLDNPNEFWLYETWRVRKPSTSTKVAKPFNNIRKAFVRSSRVKVWSGAIPSR